jgi:hypothetical protein
MTGRSIDPLFFEYSKLNNNYPKVEYSEARILKDTKNILYQILFKNTANK